MYAEMLSKSGLLVFAKDISMLLLLNSANLQSNDPGLKEQRRVSGDRPELKNTPCKAHKGAESI